MSHDPPNVQSDHDSENERANEPGAWTFFRQWLRNPRAMAALSPSSRQLAKQMIDQLPHGAKRVIELGGGTGVFTQALLAHGISAEALLVVELNEELHQLLHQRFPKVHIVCGDAQALKSIVHANGFDVDGKVDAVISGLGLLSMSRVTQRSILKGVFAVLGDEGRFIQFTYGPASPVSRELLNELDLNVNRASIAWMNVPPATVYVYTRNRSKGIRSIRQSSSRRS
ncbi:MAG: class I SAM-dependent methyltransferase [Rhodanobacteraceae bacterium]